MKAAADIIPSPKKHYKFIRKHAFAVYIRLIACKKMVKHQCLTVAHLFSLLNDCLWYDKLWGPSQRVVTLLHCFSLVCVVSQGTAWYCMVLRGNEWYYTVLQGIA